MSTPLGVGGAGVARVPVAAFAARTSSRRLHVENDGLVCFLYDEAHAGAIARSEPRILHSFEPGVTQEDPRLRDLSLRGILLAYELYRDDPLSIEVDLGPAIGPRELRSGMWLAPQSAYLHLPSGNLHVHSYSTLPFGPRIPSAPAAALRVPPGRYVVTLLRYDWYGRRMFSMFEQPPSEFIRLTPVGALRLASRPKAMLSYPAPPVSSWEGAWQITDGTFHGKLVGEIGALNSLAVNLDRDAAARLGLTAGMRIRARAGRHHYQALYLGDIRIDQILEQHGSHTLAELRHAAPFLAYMDHWQRPRRRLPSTVVVFSAGPKSGQDFAGLREGDDVALSLEREHIEPLRWTSAGVGAQPF